MSSALRSSLALLVAASLAACGSDSKSTPTPTAKNVTMTGKVEIFPPAVPLLGGATVDLTKIQLEALDPLKVLLQRPLADSRVCNPNTGPLSVNATGNYTCAIADATAITLGIVGNAIDTSTTKIQSVVTSSGLNGPFCTSATDCSNVTAGSTIPAALSAYVIPDAFHAAVGALYSPAKTPAQLGTGGVIVVFVVNPTTGATLSGVTLSMACLTANPPTCSVLYPGDLGQTGFGAPGTSTGNTGIAYVTGAPTPTPLTITATRPGSTPPLVACNPTASPPVTTNCLTPAQAGIQPGLAFVAVIPQR